MGVKQPVTDATQAAPFGERFLGLRRGDFRWCLDDVADNSVAMIVTDPPYSGKDLYLWAALGALARRVLRPGGLLVAYSGTYHSLKVNRILSRYLRRVRTDLLALRKPAGAALPYKYILVYSKGRPPRHVQKEPKIHSSPPPDKSTHPKGWTQAVEDAEWYIEHYSEPGDLLLDPMAGTGTTLVAALRLGRRALGVELDAAIAEKAMARLRE
jgi:DNA modification methylase